MDFQIFGISVVGAIMAIVTLCKETGFPQKYCPLLALLLGVGAGIFVMYPNDLFQGILTGLSVGLSATGLHSGVKNVKEGIQFSQVKSTDTLS